MRNARIPADEQYSLVMECRSSGLSDYQWCQEKGISPGTFYNWISRFRKKGYPNIPEPAGRNSVHRAVKQEVVRLEILPDTPAGSEPVSAHSAVLSAFSGISEIRAGDIAMEICAGSSVIRISNQIDPQLLSMVLSRLGGLK